MRPRIEEWKPAANSPDLTGLRVLVVEDDLDVQLFLCLSLQQFGAEVEGAASVPEAMQILPKFKPHVLVSDIAMPGEDGNALIRRIRLLSQGEGGGVPALAVTALSATEDRSRALWAGFQMYVRKPVDPQDLAERVARLAGPELGEAEAAAAA